MCVFFRNKITTQYLYFIFIYIFNILIVDTVMKCSLWEGKGHIILYIKKILKLYTEANYQSPFRFINNNIKVGYRNVAKG